ncbi:MAG: diguanylate cyclase, partial [Undibacterium sp.]|nr:diguanylate cyclase [Undibacterium sp.]
STDGKIWVGTSDAGAFYILPKEFTVHPLLISTTKGSQAKASADYVAKFYEVSKNIMLMGSHYTGMVIIDTSTLTTKRVLHDANRSSSLTDDWVNNFLLDKSGILWLSSLKSISHYTPSNVGIFNVFGGINQSNNLRGSDIYTLLETKDEDLWLGSVANGIGILRSGSDRFSFIDVNDDKPLEALPKAPILSLLQVSDGAIYIGCYRGLYQSDSKANKITRVNLSPRNPELRVTSLMQEGDQLFIGGAFGIWEKNLAEKNEIATRPLWAKPLEDKDIRQMTKAPDGAIWIATEHDGIIRIDRERNQSQQFLPDNTKPYTLSHRAIAAMLFDSRGWLWITTESGGINLLRQTHAQSDWHFEHLGKAEGLPHDTTNKVLEDNQGKIWVSTDASLAKIDPTTLQITPIAKAEGVAMSGYWSGSGSKTKGGELIFGGMGGITVLRPELIQSVQFQAPIVATHIQVGGKLIANNHEKYIGSNAEDLIIPSNTNSFSVEFAVLDFAAPEKNRYAYRLEGYDKDWQETDAGHRVAAYTNLSPGKYYLHLRGSNHTGTWSSQELILSIQVLPAWYQTWWAYLLYGLCIMATFGLALQWRLWRVNAKNAVLESLVKERTRELELSHQMLERQSLSDHLTGLPNRRYLNRCILEDIAQVKRAYQTRDKNASAPHLLNINLVFIMVDIDHFKAVNDDFGHNAGDAVLVQTAAILRDSIRESDSIIRWGGEEFLILARHTNYDETEILVERIRCRIAEHHFNLPDGDSIRKTCSLGLSSYPFVPTNPDIFTWEQVIDIADQCLYAAKHGGRNAWVGLSLHPGELLQRKISDVSFEIKTQIELGHITVKTSLPDHVKLDWSHGRSK